MRQRRLTCSPRVAAVAAPRGSLGALRATLAYEHRAAFISAITNDEAPPYALPSTHTHSDVQVGALVQVRLQVRKSPPCRAAAAAHPAPGHPPLPAAVGADPRRDGEAAPRGKAGSG